MKKKGNQAKHKGLQHRDLHKPKVADANWTHLIQAQIRNHNVLRFLIIGGAIFIVIVLMQAGFLGWTGNVAAVGFPDLAIKSIEFDTSEPITYSSPIVKITVANQGSSSSPKSMLAVFGGGLYGRQYDISSLASLQEQEITLQVSQNNPGPYSIKAAADSLGAISEQEESNNEKEASVLFVPNVEINSVPQDHEVFIDGYYYGNSPLKVSLEPGKHLVEVYGRMKVILVEKSQKTTVTLNTQ